MKNDGASGLKLFTTLALLGCAGFAFWSGNTLAAIFVFVGYALGAINVLASKLSAAATPTPERLEGLGDILKQLSDQDYAKISNIAHAGRKIEAIKELRMATGAGLKDAKEAVEMILAHDGEMAE